MSLPRLCFLMALVLALALVAVLGPGLDKIVMALTAFSIPTVAPLPRAAGVSASEPYWRTISPVSRRISPNVIRSLELD